MGDDARPAEAKERAPPQEEVFPLAKDAIRIIRVLSVVLMRHGQHMAPASDTSRHDKMVDACQDKPLRQEIGIEGYDGRLPGVVS